MTPMDDYAQRCDSAERGAMTIHHLPNDHLQLSCDSGCSNAIIRHGITEEQLLDQAEELGWNIERELGLHYCPLTTMHDCSVCGAPARMSTTDVSVSETTYERGETTYYCAQHWP